MRLRELHLPVLFTLASVRCLACAGGASSGSAEVDAGAAVDGTAGDGGAAGQGEAGYEATSEGSTPSDGAGGGSEAGAEAGGGPRDATAYAKDSESAEAASEGGTGPTLSGNQALVWLPTYLSGFKADLTAVTSSKPKAFTQVSPDFYQINYAYASGPAQISGESFDGLSVDQIAAQVHAAGMMLIPLVYGGAGNFGTDQGIQNILNDSPAGAQSSFVTSMVKEAMTRHYDGWNLDWEVQGTGYAQYGQKLIQFLTTFKAALHAANLILTVDLGDWYVRQCQSSGGDGLVDLTQIGPAVDVAILEDYSGTFGTPLSSCGGGTPPSQQSCPDQFGALLDIMCDVSPTSAVSIGLIEGQGGSGTNPFLDKALNAIHAIGFKSIAVWPDSSSAFLDPTNIPNGQTWYSLSAKFLAE